MINLKLRTSTEKPGNYDKEATRRESLKLNTNVKAGAYVGLTLSVGRGAGAGAGSSVDSSVN